MALRIGVIAMTTETQGRVSADSDDTDNVEWATKADVERVGSKVGDLDSKVGELDSKVGELGSKVGDLGSKVGELGSRVEGLASQIQNVLVEMGKLQAEQKWTAWILGVMCAALMAIFATLVVITLQL
jgi:outer membrane murein-binding lipoprotein Lpp